MAGNNKLQSRRHIQVGKTEKRYLNYEISSRVGNLAQIKWSVAVFELIGTTIQYHPKNIKKFMDFFTTE